jgi:hypothetical protein
MSHVHSTGRRCAASALNETCPFRWQTMTSPFCRRRACPFHWQTVRPYYCVHYAHHHSRVTKETAASYQYCMGYGYHGTRRLLRRTRISYFCNVFPLFCSRAHMSGLGILVRAPLSYKREGTRHYKADPHELSDSQVHTSSQAHSLNTIHSGVGYYAPAA